MTEATPNDRRSRPLVAVLITVVLLGLATHDQLTSGSVDTPLLGGLLVLAFFWAGQSVDRLLDRWSPR